MYSEIEKGMNMNSEMNSGHNSKEIINKELIEILEDMTSDWDMDLSGPIGLNTKLIEDLEFESIDVVQFIVAIEERFQRRGLPFEEFLMIDGRYVDEIKVEDAVNFLVQHIKGD
jgi:acyl carrier protein